MTLKLIFIFLFLFLLLYSLIRPFPSIVSKLFLMIGSILGLLSVTEFRRVDYFASMLGINGGKDLYLYISFVTIFLFIFYAADRFKALEKKITKLTRSLALESVKKTRTDEDS